MEHTRILPERARTEALALPGVIPPAPAVMAILARFNRDDLGAAIEVLVALLDIWDGDPDVEPNGDEEDSDGDEKGDQAYLEWHSQHGRQKQAGQCILAGQEDDEEDDPAGDSVTEDSADFRNMAGDGAGCPISDPGGCEHDGREEEHDAEWEQMGDDVPMLPAYSAGHNIFNDQRTFLGISNLQSSFVGEARSADTGKAHRGRPPRLGDGPGLPV